MTIDLSGPAAVAALVLFFGFLILIGVLSSRLLGVQRGFGRSFFAGVVGFLVFTALLSWRPSSALPQDLELAILLGVVVLATMVASVLIDALMKPSRSGRRPGLRALGRCTRAYLQSWGRLWEIARHARSHGLPMTPVTTPKGARALRDTLEESGGMLVKFGQIASTRDDLLPSVLTEELASLQSGASGLPADVVRERVETELGAPLEVLFASFDSEPLAAASIGVTHRATLHDGRRVIVKVQRPGIDDIVERDARVLKWGARRVESRSESLAKLGLAAITDELIDSVRSELDFTREQASNASMLSNRHDDPGIRFPVVIAEMTTQRVLVMDEVEGASVASTEAVDRAARSREEMADNLLQSFMRQTLIDGLFHADPHPGNILVDDAGDLWFIDYGAVGVIDPISLEGLQLLAGGFMHRDAGMMARAVRRMVGSQGTQLDIAALETDMAGILSHFSAGAGFDPAVLTEVALGLARYDVAAPRALTVLARAGVTLQGTLAIIDPGFVMGQRAQPVIAAMASEKIPDDPQTLAMSELQRALPSLRAMPQLAEDLALQTRSGRLTVRMQHFATQDREVVDSWIDRVLLVMIAVVGLVTSVILLGAGVIAEGSGVSVYLYGMGFAGLFLAGAMLLRALAQIQRRARAAQRNYSLQ